MDNTVPLIKVRSVAHNGIDYVLILDVDQTDYRYLTLSTTDWRKLSVDDIEKIFVAIDSDGCTGVPDFYLNGCIIHDFYYSTHKNFDGSDISRSEADKVLRQYIQESSRFGALSPMSWWRWLGVRIFGKGAWEKKEW